MPKSDSEKKRLEDNAKAQQILSRSFAKNIPKIENTDQLKDIYQPTGDIDYSKFNRAIKG